MLEMELNNVANNLINSSHKEDFNKTLDDEAWELKLGKFFLLSFRKFSSAPVLSVSSNPFIPLLIFLALFLC